MQEVAGERLNALPRHRSSRVRSETIVDPVGRVLGAVSVRDAPPREADTAADFAKFTVQVDGVPG